MSVGAKMRRAASGLVVPGGGFSPLDLPGLAGWWDFSDTTTITASGGSVSAVTDKSGNGRTVIQDVSIRRPTTGVTELGGLNVLDFKDDWLVAASAADWTFMHDGTVNFKAILVRYTNSTGFSAFLGTAAGGVQTGFDFFANAENQWARHGVVNDDSTPNVVDNQTANGAVPRNAWNVLSIDSDPGNGTASARSALYVNSGTAISNNTKTAAPATGDPSSPLTIGARPGGNIPLLGSIAEVIVSDQPVPGSVRADLIAYLADKWSL